MVPPEPAGNSFESLCITTTIDSIEVGKYLVSPLTKRLENGRYAASVSIRTGRGSATHDRVLRLVPSFDTPQAAIRYATHQGLHWLGEPARPAATLTLQP